MKKTLPDSRKLIGHRKADLFLEELKKEVLVQELMNEMTGADKIEILGDPGVIRDKIFAAWFIRGQTMKSIGEKYGITESTVSQGIKRAART